MNDRLHWWEDIPLALALLAQSYVVGLWYYASIKGASDRVDLVVAIGAGLALDLIVVTTVMGRRQGRSSGWSWATSFGAFGCSSLIALDRYGWEWRSLLHVAFPLVVFLYSQHLATPRKTALAPQPAISDVEQSEDSTLIDSDLALNIPLPSLPSAGSVYVLYSESNGVKIGCATDVAKRVQSIAAFLPFEVHLVHTIPTSDMYRLENAIHRYYEMAGKRLNGEWFRLDAHDLQAIQRVSASDADRIFNDASRVLAPIVLSGVRLLDDTDTSIVLKSIAKSYPCPHCGSALRSKQAVGAAVKNGYCPACKAVRKAA